MRIPGIAAAVLAWAAQGDGKVAWEKKAETALAASAATGKPVCFYFTTGEQVKGKEAPGC
jgi:hypothetical protein